ncbi:hypothetical protein BpHYR1_037275, partial [Brachionus plicatilis]
SSSSIYSTDLTSGFQQIFKETKGTAENLSVCKFIVSAINRGVDYYIKLLYSLIKIKNNVFIVTFKHEEEVFNECSSTLNILINENSVLKSRLKFLTHSSSSFLCSGVLALFDLDSKEKVSLELFSTTILLDSSVDVFADLAQHLASRAPVAPDSLLLNKSIPSSNPFSSGLCLGPRTSLDSFDLQLLARLFTSPLTFFPFDTLSMSVDSRDDVGESYKYVLESSNSLV